MNLILYGDSTVVKIGSERIIYTPKIGAMIILRYNSISYSMVEFWSSIDD